MRLFKLILPTSFAAFCLVSCGGDGEGSSPSVSNGDTQAPVITIAPSSLELPENIRYGISISVSDNSASLPAPVATCTMGLEYGSAVVTTPSVDSETRGNCRITVTDASGNVGETYLYVTIKDIIQQDCNGC